MSTIKITLTKDQNQGLISLEDCLSKSFSDPDSVQAFSSHPYAEEARGIVSFAVQFEKSAGLLKAEDAYSQANNQLSKALGKQPNKTCKKYLELMLNLVSERMKLLSMLKRQFASSIPPSNKKSKNSGWTLKSKNNPTVDPKNKMDPKLESLMDHRSNSPVSPSLTPSQSTSSSSNASPATSKDKVPIPGSPKTKADQPGSPSTKRSADQPGSPSSKPKSPLINNMNQPPSPNVSKKSTTTTTTSIEEQHSHNHNNVHSHKSNDEKKKKNLPEGTLNKFPTIGSTKSIPQNLQAEFALTHTPSKSKIARKQAALSAAFSPSFEQFLNEQQKKFREAEKEMRELTFWSSLRVLSFIKKSSSNNSNNKAFDSNNSNNKAFDAYFVDTLKTALQVDSEMNEKISKSSNNNGSCEEELELRLGLLDSNPFYSADLFSTTQDFNRWKKEEESKIIQLMKSISHQPTRKYSKTKPNATILDTQFFTESKKDSSSTNYSLPPKFDAHRCFSFLFSGLVKFSLPSTNSDFPELPDTFLKFLSQYGNYWGVGEVFSSILMIDALAKGFHHSSSHLSKCLRSLSTISTISNQPWTISEKEVLISSCELILTHSHNRMARLRKCFSSKNIQDIKPFVKVISMSVDQLNSMREMKMESKALIKGGIQKCVALDYQELLLLIEKHISEEERVKSIVSSSKLTSLCEMIEDEMEEWNSFFEFLDDSGVNSEEQILSSFSELLSNDLSDFMSTLNKPNVVLTKELFELAFHLRRFNDILSSFPDLQLMPLRPFEGLVVRWIDQSKSKLLEWNSHAIKADNWEKMEGTLHSSSIVDMFSALYAPVPIILDSLFLQSESNPTLFLISFSKLVQEVISQYCFEVEERSLSEIGVEMRPFFDSFVQTVGTASSSRISNPQRMSAKNVLNSTKDFVLNKFRSLSSSGSNSSTPQSPTKPNSTPSPQLNNNNNRRSGKISPHITEKNCIMINNIEVARLKLVEVEEEMGSEMTELLRHSFEILKTCKLNLQSLILFKMNEPLSRYLRQMVSDEKFQLPSRHDSEKYQSQLFDYLDQQLMILSNSLYPSVFTKTIKLLWQSVLNLLIEMLLPDSGQFAYSLEKASSYYLGVEQATIFEDLLDPLINFFNADGEGLPNDFLQSGSTVFVRSIIALYEVDSESLVDLYNTSLKSHSTSSHIVSSTHLLNLIERQAKKGDKQAQSFLKKFFDSQK